MLSFEDKNFDLKIGGSLKNFLPEIGKDEGWMTSAKAAHNRFDRTSGVVLKINLGGSVSTRLFQVLMSYL